MWLFKTVITKRNNILQTSINSSWNCPFSVLLFWHKKVAIHNPEGREPWIYWHSLIQWYFSPQSLIFLTSPLLRTIAHGYDGKLGCCPWLLGQGLVNYKNTAALLEKIVESRVPTSEMRNTWRSLKWSHWTPLSQARKWTPIGWRLRPSLGLLGNNWSCPSSQHNLWVSLPLRVNPWCMYAMCKKKMEMPLSARNKLHFGKMWTE